ncbi:hypothetical protein SDC9_120653 [bioreactor metagenome]|uniref:D-inositol-3-phosphate glycosyltransferase n=1 Tax=bioreactor metagenome TaxID=1076179 RepID=A0A645C8E9_9ZZZZ
MTPPDDPQAFGEVLGHVLANRDAWDYLGQDARRAAEAWSDSALAGRLAGLYRQLVAARQPQAVALTAET